MEKHLDGSDPRALFNSHGSALNSWISKSIFTTHGFKNYYDTLPTSRLYIWCDYLQMEKGSPSMPPANAIPFINVKDYGAVGDGTTDDTAAINAAVQAAQIASSDYSSPGQLTSFAYPWLYFPAGKYKISSTISPDMNVFGEKSIIIGAENNFDLFRLASGYPTIDSLSFRGGNSAISISTNDVSDITITIMRCDFQGRVFAAIATDGHSNSTAIHVHDCHFYMGGAATSPGGSVLNAKTGDSIVFRDCWIGAPIGNDVFVLGDPQNYQTEDASGAELQIYNLSGGPDDAVGAWIKIWGGSVHCHHCRFGGENGGKVIVENFSSYSEIYIWDTAAFHTDGPHYMLHRIPAFFKVHDSNGNGHGIWLESGNTGLRY